jgi:hypothetical protein
MAGLVAIAGVIEFFLRSLLTRPFYFDEAWRAYDIALGPRFLAHLDTAGAPLALGWVAIEDAARVVLGDTQAGLRAPMFAALPVLGIATYLLARRWLGVGVSFCVAALLLVNSWTVNNALQLKSYSYEGLLAIVAVAVFLLLQRTSWRPAQLVLLYAALGLTCVFSLPNLFVVGPLLVLDLVQAIRARQGLALRLAGEALAGAIALAHYVLFVRPQAEVAANGFWNPEYAPQKPVLFVRFVIRGLQSWLPTMVTGVAGATNATPSYTLPAVARDALAIALLVLLAAGVVAAARDAAGRALIVVIGGAIVLQLIASTAQRWPFGLVRVNIFLLPLLYIVAGVGVVRLARLLRGRARADSGPAPVTWWRGLALGAGAVALAAAGAIGGVATAKALAQTSRMQAEPTDFSGLRSAVASARLLGARDDLVIIRGDRNPPLWYADGWLYYMHYYAGYPAAVAARPAIPARNTLPVYYVTPAAVGRFLRAHPASPAIFLLEYNIPGGTFPAALHQESLTTLRRFGYCPTREFGYPATGHMTVLLRGACRAPGR